MTRTPAKWICRMLRSNKLCPVCGCKSRLWRTHSLCVPYSQSCEYEITFLIPCVHTSVNAARTSVCATRSSTHDDRDTGLARDACDCQHHRLYSRWQKSRRNSHVDLHQAGKSRGWTRVEYIGRVCTDLHAGIAQV